MRRNNDNSNKNLQVRCIEFHFYHKFATVHQWMIPLCTTTPTTVSSCSGHFLVFDSVFPLKYANLLSFDVFEGKPRFISSDKIFFQERHSLNPLQQIRENSNTIDLIVSKLFDTANNGILVNTEIIGQLIWLLVSCPFPWLPEAPNRRNPIVYFVLICHPISHHLIWNRQTTPDIVLC